MFRSILIHIVNRPILFFGALFLFRAGLWGWVENLWRARSVPYRQVAVKDFVAQTFVVFVISPIMLYLYGRLFADYPFPQVIQDLPILLRIGLYFLIGDFGYYWGHRLMHTGVLWRTHKWHHCPTYMYWLAGCRATVPHEFFILVTFLLLTPILHPAPWWVYTGVVIFGYLASDWMHLNVSWRARWLEWFIVMPRYHHIHHSCNPDHYNFNLGNIFTFWDRLFGTYLDPDTLDPKQIAFGIGERPNPLRLIAGL